MTRNPTLRFVSTAVLVAAALLSAWGEPAATAQAPEDVITVCPPPGTGCDYTTIQEAIDNGNPGDTIWVAEGVYVENLQIDFDLEILGGYSGPPHWIRDPEMYETTIDGSANPPIIGDWDGAQVRYPMVIEDGGVFEMWYTGCDMAGTCRVGYAESYDGGYTWDRYPDPVLDVGAGGAWDTGSLEAPFVIQQGPNSYQMWYSGFGPEACAIGYATSTDGINWTKQGDAPVLGPGDQPWNNNCVLHPSVLYEGGIYKMWLLALGDDGSGPAPYMAYATSTDGYSDWAWHESSPLFGRSWEGWLWRPFVLHRDAFYYMWYSAWSDADGGSVGVAVSPTGYDEWLNYGGPVLSGDPGEWDEDGAVDPSVYYDGGVYRMWYDNFRAIGEAHGSIYAWNKYGGNPIFEPGWYGVEGMPTVRIETPGEKGRVGRQVWSALEGRVSPEKEPVQEPIAVLLDGLRILGGQAFGGGVKVVQAEATINGCWIYNNTAVFGAGGGGVAVEDPSAFATITGSEIWLNDAQDGGGVMFWNGASGMIQDSLIRNNNTYGGPGGGLEIHGGGAVVAYNMELAQNHSEDSGGGIAVLEGGELHMHGGEVRQNTASNQGGGIYASNSPMVQLDDVDVVWNESLQGDGEGGGLSFWNGTTANLSGVTVGWTYAEHGAAGINVGEESVLTLADVDIRHNTSRWSAGLRLHRSQVFGNRVWIFGNEATEGDQGGFQLGDNSWLGLMNAVIAHNWGGAGAAWDNSSVELYNATVVDNSRDDDQAGISIAGDSSAEVYNSILAYNGAYDLSCDEGASCYVEYSDLQHPWEGPGNISTNPRFVSRKVGDYHLQGGSPCIDAANPGVGPGDDFEGDARPYDGDDVPGALPDMGVDEYTGEPMPIEPDLNLWVDGSLELPGNGTPEDPYNSVNWALYATFTGDTVHVADGTYVENIWLERDLSILGGYSGVPDWERDPDLYETVLDGSANPTIPGDWDGNIGMPFVVWDDNANEYRMYYNGSGAGYPWTIGLATSPDGVSWEQHEGNPILWPDGDTWEDGGLYEPYVRIEGENEYRMWYDNGGAIGYATSTDGINWDKHPGPIFEPDPMGWDSAVVRVPSVVWTGGEYLMSYIGHDGSGVWQMGVATSPNGVDGWSRFDPVLGPGPGPFDEDAIYRPDLAFDGSTYHLLYVGVSGGWNQWRLGVATSPNGFDWEKHGGNPVLPGDDPWENQGAWGAGHFLDGAVWRAWYAAMGDEGGGFGMATSGDGFEWIPDSEHNPVVVPGEYGQDGAPVIGISTPGDGSRSAGPEGPTGLLRLPARQGIVQEAAHVLLNGLTVTGGVFWDGGGIHIENAVAGIEDCVVQHNEAIYNGGGVSVYGDGSASIFETRVLDNLAGEQGGGVWNHGPLTVDRTLVQANVAGQVGGGMTTCCPDGSGEVTIQNTMVVQNHGGWAGGIAPFWQGTLMNVTVADNTCTEEDCVGGVGLASELPEQTQSLVNSIFYYNQNWDLSWDGDQTYVEYCDVFTSAFELTGPGNIDGDPLFADAYHLTSVSPPRDAGTHQGAPDHDYDGDGRPYKPGTLDWDMGADEWWPTPVYLPLILRNYP